MNPVWFPNTVHCLLVIKKLICGARPEANTPLSLKAIAWKWKTIQATPSEALTSFLPPCFLVYQIWHSTHLVSFLMKYLVLGKQCTLTLLFLITVFIWESRKGVFFFTYHTSLYLWFLCECLVVEALQLLIIQVQPLLPQWL